MNKKCRRCGFLKNKDLFSKNKEYKDGYLSI